MLGIAANLRKPMDRCCKLYGTGNRTFVKRKNCAMSRNRALLIRVLIFGTIAFLAIYIGSVIIQEGKQLPVYSPSDLTPELVDSSMHDVSSGHQIDDFHLLDQYGDTVTRSHLEGKVTVVNFFFTSCQGICPKMNSNINEVAGAFKGNDKVQFFSHTVDPSYDTVEVLNEYAKQYTHTGEQWHFLTGSKKEIYDLARRSYFAVRTQGEGGKSDFIHTENVLLVDGKGRLRGFYDGTSDQAMEKLQKEIRILLP